MQSREPHGERKVQSREPCSEEQDGQKTRPQGAWSRAQPGAWHCTSSDAMGNRSLQYYAIYVVDGLRKYGHASHDRTCCRK